MTTSGSETAGDVTADQDAAATVPHQPGPSRLGSAGGVPAHPPAPAVESPDPDPADPDPAEPGPDPAEPDPADPRPDPADPDPAEQEEAAEPGPGDRAGRVLTDREREILAFERKWWRHPGAKEQAIRDTFELSATRYYQILNGLLDDPAALAHDPVVVGRLRRVRASHARAHRPG